MGMKNHELVPLELIASIARIHRGSVARSLADLLEHKAVAHEREKRCTFSPFFMVSFFDVFFPSGVSLCEQW